VFPFNEAIKDKIPTDNFAPVSNQTKPLSDPDNNGSNIDKNNPDNLI
jgi:hypothetical protein